MVNIYNIHAYPFIGIIDPRTGEKLIQLPANKLDSCSFCEKITSFLCDFEMPIEDDTESSEVVKVEEDEVVVLNGGNKKEVSNKIKYIILYCKNVYLRREPLVKQVKNDWYISFQFLSHDFIRNILFFYNN